MKLKKLFLSISIIFTLCIAFGISVNAATSGIFTYSVSNGEATITDCSTSASSKITIPSTLGGYPVTTIRYQAFYNCNKITSITIPDSVTSIGSDAFYDCSSLESISIPDSVTTIDKSAFANCSSLKKVYVSNIENWCNINFVNDWSNPIYYGATLYFGDEMAEDIVIPNTVTSIGKYAFKGCNSLTSITIPDSVTSIGDDAFRKCSSLTSITIPDSVTSIGNSAFSDCSSLTSITIPDSVTSIGRYAFEDTAYYVDTANWINNVLYIGNHLIEAKDSIRGSYTIKNGTKIIGSYSFYECSSLTSITIPDSVTSIGRYAFSDCSSLASITIPDSVTSIGRYAFEDCSSITSITIPDGVTSIGDASFKGCSSLGSINVDENNNSYSSEDGILFNKNKTRLICYPKGKKDTFYLIPDSVTSIGSYSFYECSSLTSITIPDSVTSIGDDAFRKCSSLTSITIPDSVTSIGSQAFWYCNSLDSVYIDSVEVWCDIQFGDSTSNPLYYADKLYVNNELLTEVIIPEGVTMISGGLFRNCSSLKSITIPDSVTSIGSYAFSECSSLESITIPENVTSIGEYVFIHCKNLTNVYWNAKNVVSIERSNIFSDAGTSGNGINVVFGDTVEKIPASLFYISHQSSEDYSFKIKSITIGENVTSIGEKAFYGCTGLTQINWNAKNIPNFSKSSPFSNSTSENGIKVVFGDKVERIPQYAFYNRNVTDIEISDSVQYIPRTAFEGCNYLTNTENYENGILYADNWILAVDSTISGVCTIKSSCVGVAEGVFQNCNLVRAVKIDTLENWLKINFCSRTSNPTYNGAMLYIGENKLPDSIVVPDGVTKIGSYTFVNCSELMWVSMPQTLTSVGDYAFADCAKLGSMYIEFPDSITSIGEGAFQNTAIVRAVLPKNLSVISDYLFDGSSLENVTIPESVTSIGRYAFSDTNLRQVDIPKNVTVIGESAFNDTSIKYINIPDGVTKIELHTFKECDELSIVILGDGVETIGYEAFYSCRKLKTVVIPKSVTSIDGYAFKGWSSYGTPNIQDVYYDGSELEWLSVAIDVESNQPLLNANMHYQEFVKTTGISFNNTELTINRGEQATLTLTFTPDNASIKDVSIESISCPNILDIEYNADFWLNGKGDLVIKGIAEGEGEIDVAIRSPEGIFNTECKVTVTGVSGDMDGDGEVKIKDVVQMFKHLMDPEEYPYEGSCDVNGDGKENMQDAVYLFKHMMDPVTYPIG